MGTPLTASSVPDQAVWQRLWDHEHPDKKDDVLLAREQRCHRWEMIVEAIESRFGSIAGLKTIELGSGRGDLSALLAKRGARVTLLDANDTALSQARHRFERLGLSATYTQGDMLDLDNSSRGSFDVALSSGVIEHFQHEGRAASVRAHLEVLRPGGLSIISVPNAWCLPYRLWKFYLELRGWWPYGMEIPYTRWELGRLGQAVGFEQTELRCTGFWQSISAHWARSLLGMSADWSQRRSWLDGVFGFTLVMFGSCKGGQYRTTLQSKAS